MIVGMLAAPVWAARLGSAISDQGRLTDGGTPVNGGYDFQCTLYYR